MGQFTTATSFVAIASTSASGTATGYSSDNAALYAYPNRVWRGTATNSTLTVNFASTPIGAVVLDNINSTQVTIGGGANVAVAKDAADGRYKVYYPTTATVTSLQIANTSGTTTDGANFTIGSVAVIAATALTTWTINAEFPYEVTPLWPVIDNDQFTGGGREPVLIGNRYCRIGLTQSNFPISVWSEIGNVATIGRHQPIMFYRNASSTAEVYICRRVGDVTMSLAGPGHFGVRGLLLEECV